MATFLANFAVPRCTRLINVSVMYNPPCIRYRSSRKNCEEPKPPSCSPAAIKHSPCGQRTKKENAKDKKEQAKPKSIPKSLPMSLWANTDCCKNPCDDMLPRFDDLYYKISDKAKRKYTQTWIECPPAKKAPKMVCNFEDVGLPPLVKRPRKHRPKTACPPIHPLKAKEKNTKKCPKICMFGCRKVRDPPKCIPAKFPSTCQKRLCPYPSFSECVWAKPKPRRAKECNCTSLPPLCVIYEYLERMKKLGLY